MALFTAASILAAGAPSVPVLVAARVFKGIGAAAMTPASLAIIGLSLHPDDLAGSVFAAVSDHDVGIASAATSAIARAEGLVATAVLPFLAGAGTDIPAPGSGDAYRRPLTITGGMSVVAAVVGRVLLRQGLLRQGNVVEGE